MQGKGGDGGRRQTRQRKVSARMAVVDSGTRQQAAQARLDALEEDNNAGGDAFGGVDEDDQEFMVGDSDGSEPEFGGRKGKKRKAAAASIRKTRGMLAHRRGGPLSFARLLEESGLDHAPPDEPSYLTTAAGPSAIAAPRKFCSVCGFESTYTCVRCGSRYCSRKCYTVHTDTRCLKFIA